MPTVVGLHIWPEGSEQPRSLDVLDLDWGGPVGDRHHGLTMPAGPRQAPVHPRGTEVRNHRQVSLVDVAELAIIAANLGIETLAPGVIADNICTEGLDHLTHSPPMTRLIVGDADVGPVLVVGGENVPCTIAGRLVEAVYGTRPESFPKAAMGLRGVTAWVERPGQVLPGASIRVVAP